MGCSLPPKILFLRERSNIVRYKKGVYCPLRYTGVVSPSAIRQRIAVLLEREREREGENPRYLAKRQAGHCPNFVLYATVSAGSRLQWWSSTLLERESSREISERLGQWTKSSAFSGLKIEGTEGPHFLSFALAVALRRPETLYSSAAPSVRGAGMALAAGRQSLFLPSKARHRVD